MSRKGKYTGNGKPWKRKAVRGDIEEFDAQARARGLTYAQAQVEETCRRYQSRIVVPEHYRKAGDRGLRE